MRARSTSRPSSDRCWWGPSSGPSCRASPPTPFRAGTASAITQALSVGLANLVFTAIAVLVLDRIGRRPLLMTGTAGCVVSLSVLGAFFASGWLQHNVPWLALVCLIVYIASFAVGLGPVVWLMISEIFPLRVRGPAMSLSTVGNWTANFSSPPSSCPSPR